MEIIKSSRLLFKNISPDLNPKIETKTATKSLIFLMAIKISSSMKNGAALFVAGTKRERFGKHQMMMISNDFNIWWEASFPWVII